MAKYLTSAPNPFVAEILRGRLLQAGIHSVVESFIRGGGSAGDIYVEEEDLVRAREVLRAAESFSEEELVKLSEEARPAEPNP